VETPSQSSPETRKPPRSSWAKWLWLATLAGFLIAVGPLLIAVYGAMTNDRDLMVYHWFVFYTAPVGLPIMLLAGIAALVLTIRNISARR
jgi:uncharacterized integral membrane protein